MSGMGRSARCALLALLLPTAAAAQWPGRIEGRVVEAGSGAPVEAALVRLEDAAGGVLTDASGRFVLRGLEPGRATLRVDRIGYAEVSRAVEIENGRTARVTIALPVAAVEVAGIEVRGARSRASVLERAEIDGSGARTAGDLLGRVPGAVVRREGATGPQTVSLRGAGADAVLVLLDGVTLNDPITGAADLSTVPASAIESMTVLRGAHSARYGPSAEAGVILIETRHRARPAVEAGVGSLGVLEGRGEWGLAVGGAALTAGVDVRRVGGGFEFDIPAAAGGGEAHRVNDDLTEAGGWASLHGTLGGGELTVRGGYDGLERGLPGKGFAPSTAARQGLDRFRGSADWRRAAGRVGTHVVLAAVSQTVRFHDTAPPFGQPYDDTTALRGLELRSELDRRLDTGPLSGVGGGIEAAWQRIDAAPLEADGLGERLDLGVFGHLALDWRIGRVPFSLAAQGRLDRDAVAGRWFASRGVTLGAELGPLAVHLANRSSYTPPSLGDQFFREGVGVEPNPHLRPERVPSELELGLSAESRLGPALVTASVTAYRGDIRDMIVWAPDFRFIWSPRNFDTRRSGGEIHAELVLPPAAARLDLGYAYNRVVYDRPGGSDPVQVVYRPRHTAMARAEWRPGPWRMEAQARFTGARNPVPAPVNALAGFWTLDLALGRTLRLGTHQLEPRLRVDRALDEKSSLIFGFPEPGRTVGLSLRWRPATVPQP